MRTDYEEALLKVSDALRRHNKPAGGISSRKACEDILEAVRPKGKWIHSYDDFYVCSLCGRGICTDWETEPYKHYPFCHCGADMRGGTDD